MTTIDHQQAAVEAGARMLNPDAWEAYDRSDKTHWERGMVRRSLEESEEVLTAAEPHLRAAWAEQIRDEVNVPPGDFSDDWRSGFVLGVLTSARILEGGGE